MYGKLQSPACSALFSHPKLHKHLRLVGNVNLLNEMHDVFTQFTLLCVTRPWQARNTLMKTFRLLPLDPNYNKFTFHRH